MTSLPNITAERFDVEVLQSARPVVVDFWHELCRPCMALKPTLEEATTIYSDRVAIYTAHVEEAYALHQRCGVRSMPTLILFKHGEEVARVVGNQTSSQLAAFIDQAL
jgi:thioredoxin 1